MPNKIITKKELETVIKEVFKSEELSKYRKNMRKGEIEKEDEIIDECIGGFFDKKDFKILNWDLFDFAEKDMKINEHEYPFLIKALLESPEEQLFDLTLDNKKNTMKGSHPTVRERVLFLEKANV